MEKVGSNPVDRVRSGTIDTTRVPGWERKGEVESGGGEFRVASQSGIWTWQRVHHLRLLATRLSSLRCQFERAFPVTWGLSTSADTVQSTACPASPVHLTRLFSVLLSLSLTHNTLVIAGVNFASWEQPGDKCVHKDQWLENCQLVEYGARVGYQ